MTDQEFLEQLWKNMSKWHHLIILREMIETYGSTEFIKMVKLIEKRISEDAVLEE